MTILEIRNLYKEEKFEDIKIIGKKYITLTQKITSIEGYDYEVEDGETGKIEIIHSGGIIDNAFKKDKDTYKVDMFLYELHLMYAILDRYTDIDFDGEEFGVDDYDMFMNLYQYEEILHSADVKNFIELLSASLNNRYSELNSLSKVAADGINKLILAINDLTDSGKLDSMLKTISKAIKKNPALNDYMKTYVENNGANK